MTIFAKSERGATYQDLIDAPPRMIAEVIRGKLITRPLPAPKEAVAASHIGALLGDLDCKGRRSPSDWWILHKPELHLGRDVLVPDLAGWTRDRMPTLAKRWSAALPPDWVCETLAPARVDQFEVKREIYAENGVAHLWNVDPRARTLETFELHDGGWRRLAALRHDAEVRQPPFDTIGFPLTVLWA